MHRFTPPFSITLFLFLLTLPLGSNFSPVFIHVTAPASETPTLNDLSGISFPSLQSRGRNDTCDYTTYHVGGRILSLHAGVNRLQGTNATDVIQRTLDLLSNGGTECLESGTYRLDHGLIIANSYVNFLGQGTNTVLTFANASIKDNLLTIGLGVRLPINPPSVNGVIRNVTVSNLLLDGRKTTTDPAISGGEGFEVQNMGIWALGARYITISNVWVRNVGQYCITFRATGANLNPFSSLSQPSLYDVVIGSHLFDCRTGIYLDGVVQAPSTTMGQGNQIVGNTVIQDWNTMDIDVPGNSQGFGIADFGNLGTIISGNYVQGYTPNPSIPSHTSYAAYLIDGNSTSLVSNSTALNSYFGIGFGLSGAASSASTLSLIDGFTTQGVRYSIGIGGATNSLAVNRMVFTDPMDAVNGLAGIGIWIDADVRQLLVTDLEGKTDGTYAAIGSDGLLQIARDAQGLGRVEVVGGAQHNLDLDFVIDTYPTSLTIKGVYGYDPVGNIGNPFSFNPKWISPFGDAAGPVPSEDYSVNGSDVNLTSTGGIGVSITVRDSEGNIVAAPGGEVAGYLVVQGCVVNFGAFSEAPYVMVSGN